MSGAAAAVLRGVSYRYPERTAFALRGIDWTIEAGSFVVVTGPSGSGKSTLLRCLNGLVPHFSGGELGGQALVAGLDTREHGPRVLSQHVGFVFQDPEAQLVTTRVDDELAFGMEQRGVPPLTMRKRVEEVLDLLGIADLLQREVTTLSGGERQRVAVAAALALQPSILVLDEPTSQLDPWGAESVLAALSRLNEELGLTIVLAEHRLERVMARADVLRYLPDPGMLGFEGNLRDVMVKMEADFLPPLVQIARDRGWRPLPLTIKEGRAAVRRDRAAGWEPPSLVDSSRPSGAPVPRVEAARWTEVRAEHHEVLSGLSTRGLVGDRTPFQFHSIPAISGSVVGSGSAPSSVPEGLRGAQRGIYSSASTGRRSRRTTLLSTARIHETKTRTPAALQNTRIPYR